MSLSARLNEALQPVFGKPPIFISDDPQLARWLTECGCNASVMNTEALASLTKLERKNIVLLPTKREAMSFFLLERFFRGSRVLIVPLAAFDPSLEASIYTVNLLASSDFSSATQKNREWIKLLQSDVDRLTFAASNGELQVVLKERIDLMLPKEEAALLPGEWEAVGMFFEIAMIPDNEDFFHPGYLVTGEVEVEGVAVAHHRIMPEGLVGLPSRAWELLRSTYEKGGFPLRVSIENSQIKQARTRTGIDLTKDLLRYSNPHLELMLVEMAISNNPGVRCNEVNWGINSVLNEGILGLHFAVGDGVTGAHIDFICPGMTLPSPSDARA